MTDFNALADEIAEALRTGQSGFSMTDAIASLRHAAGAGWKLVGQATTKPGQGWNVKTRPRVDTHPLQQKLKWEAV